MELLATPSSTEPAPARTGGAPRAALPGLFVCVLVAMAADGASLIASTHGMAMGALSIALVIGLGVGNLVPGTQGSTWSAGVAFAKRHVLRTGIVLYGFRLTLGDIESAGLRVVAIDVVTLASTFALAVSVGVRLFKLDTPTAVLIGAGASICGTSAVLSCCKACCRLRRLRPARFDLNPRSTVGFWKI